MRRIDGYIRHPDIVTLIRATQDSIPHVLGHRLTVKWCPSPITTCGLEIGAADKAVVQFYQYVVDLNGTRGIEVAILVRPA